MHSAWHIDDIRFLIFEYLSPRDLAGLAQSSQSFFSYTVDELWKTIRTPAALISCIPDICRDRSLRLTDLERLDFYTAKIQNLCFESSDPGKVIRLPGKFTLKKELFRKYKIDRERILNDSRKSWEALWNEIARLRPASQFLPNLRMFRFNNAAEELLLPLVGIGGSNLNHIYIKIIHHRQPESIVYKFLDSLQETSKLEYLFVRDGEPDLIPTKLIEQAPLKHLRLDPRIHTNCLHGEDLKFKAFPLRTAILQKESLNQLTIGLTREWYSPSLDSLKSSCLPNLKVLFLTLTTFTPLPCKSNCSNASSESWTCSLPPYQTSSTAAKTPCGREPPMKLFSLLASPQLKELHIKFPIVTSGSQFVSLISAIKSTCDLTALKTLALAPSSSYNNCPECSSRPAPIIQPIHLRRALTILSPLPNLQVLKLQVAPNFLDPFDISTYERLAEAIPEVKTLWLGHGVHTSSSEFSGTTHYDTSTFKSLAAFCSFLPKLEEISVGTIRCYDLEYEHQFEWDQRLQREWEENRVRWACDGVKRLHVWDWSSPTNRAGSVEWPTLMRNLRAYFPNSDLAQEGPNRRMWLFEGT